MAKCRRFVCKLEDWVNERGAKRRPKKTNFFLALI